ncbi:dethiobiotin synthase [Paenibacillus sp. FSL H8-0548]|uniref:dethiobiotin synthase n=1 Tax=Paenibacillus sp. FSL H8-0548 TaxID=1920422 RepID=UPI00096F3605|nr:dethiobiotin synthase [Paenibacillus sp. FSL H8-0548]OMF23259.1 dethiobiotin synthase [Paenibacillus sp. FSL H8-0548]
MRSMRGLFVVGTDTGVGKTIVTAALTAALRADNRNVGIWKPVQSGELLGSGATDAERLLRYAGLNEQPEAVATFTFEAPLTPLLAAKQSGVTLTLQGLAAAGEDLLHRYESLLIEGAGGAAVPLTDDYLMVDLISELRIPALIVARSGLGTINHTLLTMSYLRENGVPIIGFIFNDGQLIDTSGDPSVATNAELIERYSGIKFLGHFPYLKDEINTESLIHAVREQIQLETIAQALTIQTN